MAKPWRTVDSIDTDEGLLDLRQRGETDFLITIDNRVLMNSSANMSEMVLGEPRAGESICTATGR